MKRTEGFRKQHNEMLEIVNEITNYLNIDTIQDNIKEVRTLFIRLVGKLGVHLTMEDKSLYPQLLEHNNQEVKETAKKFMDEMGGIGAALDTYKKKWIQFGAMLDDPQQFINDTKEIFSALGDRIERENNELYKMVDSLE